MLNHHWCQVNCPMSELAEIGGHVLVTCTLISAELKRQTKLDTSLGYLLIKQPSEGLTGQIIIAYILDIYESTLNGTNKQFTASTGL